MAKCGQTAAQFIAEAFRPRVAVMASPEVEAICMKNDLTLTELLQPFNKVNQDGESAMCGSRQDVICDIVPKCETCEATSYGWGEMSHLVCRETCDARQRSGLWKPRALLTSDAFERTEPGSCTLRDRLFVDCGL